MARARQSLVLLIIVVVVMGGVAASATAPADATNPTPGTIGTSDWPTYGHDAQHSFAGVWCVHFQMAKL